MAAAASLGSAGGPESTAGVKVEQAETRKTSPVLHPEMNRRARGLTRCGFMTTLQPSRVIQATASPPVVVFAG
jgi:hypothetical protein